jgi:hypothetical protein
MIDRTTSPGDDGYGDDLAALDHYSAPPDEPSGLAVFGEYVPEADEDVSGLDALGEYVSADAPEDDIDDVFDDAPLADQHADDAEASGPLFSATNPPGTVTVTVYMNGSVQHVDLSPSVAKMTESQLSQEIRDLAAIATEKARAGQFVFLLYAGVQQVGDSPALRDLLSNTLGLPTPEQAAEKEATFASRYVRNES